MKCRIADCYLRADDPDESKDHEHIDNMEREKIIEFLQEKNKSTANMRSGK